MNFQAIFKNQSSVPAARKFGITFGLVLFFWGWILLRHNNMSGHGLFAAGYICLLLALVFPVILMPVHRLFMVIGTVIGFIFTGVILTGFFYLIVIPIGLIAKLLGKKFIQKEFGQKKATYWNNQEVIDIDKDSYKKQY